MKFRDPSKICAICHRKRGFGTDHRLCSIEMQKQSSPSKPLVQRKRAYSTQQDLDYWSGIDKRERKE
jgi:hypothetical protein